MGLVTLIFDLLTLNWYASRIKGGEPSFQIRARYRPLGSRIIRYVRDGQTGRRANGRADGRTDKSNAYYPFPTGAGHNNATNQ